MCPGCYTEGHFDPWNGLEAYCDKHALESYHWNKKRVGVFETDEGKIQRVQDALDGITGWRHTQFEIYRQIKAICEKRGLI